MYISCLLINVGENPDRPRPGRLWLRNRYCVHQRLCMAFPSSGLKADDPLYLKPYAPDGFQHVHGPRTEDQAFLFRVDPLPGSREAILVQSGTEPDWDYAFHNAGYLLACAPQVRPFHPLFGPDQRLRFRLLANPVRKVSPRSVDVAGKPFGNRWVGKDVPVLTADLHRWLERRAEPLWSVQKNSEGKQFPPGFRLLEILPPQGGYVYWNNKDKPSDGRLLRSARYDGILQVTDPAPFHDTLIRGVGPGKAFGFGLLSVAPLRQEAQP